MLYFILRPVLRLALQIYFRKIYLHGLEHIPPSGPLILASNHPSAFLEGCLLACFQPRSLYFMVRGDVFVHPFYRRLLVALHQIPIYRFVDGFSNLRHNQSTMATTYQVLAQGKTILIFCEGRTIFEKKLQPLQKGTARMAFGAMEQMGIADIPVVPVGVNFTCFNVFRSEVMINFGPPLYAKSYFANSNANQNSAVVALTDQLEQRLKSLTVNVKRIEDEPYFNRVVAQTRPKSFIMPWPVVIFDDEPFRLEVDHADKINQGTLSATPLPPKSVAPWKKYLLYFLGLFWYLPFTWATHIADKRVTSAPFYGPVLFGVATFLTLIYLFIVIIAAAFVGGWWGLCLLLAFMFLSYLALLLNDVPWHPDKAPDKYTATVHA